MEWSETIYLKFPTRGDFDALPEAKVVYDPVMALNTGEEYFVNARYEAGKLPQFLIPYLIPAPEQPKQVFL